MAERFDLSRWLPTMLGVLVAVGVVMAYEFDLIEREPVHAQTDCEPTREQAPASRSRDPIAFGSRPRPSSPADSPEIDQLALLATQNALLADRNVTGEIAYYNHSKPELEAMARHCDVRTDYPKNIDATEAEDLGLDSTEREAWTRALQAFADEELEQYRALLAEIAPHTPELEAMTLAQVRRQLTLIVSKARTADDDSLQREVAEERAGLRDTPDDRGALSAWNRYNRLRFDAGDRFAAKLGAQLGEDRAHELRSVFEGWPGARTRQWGCPGERKE